MRNNFEMALKSRVLVYEGGKVDDPRDPGGKTNQGVTQATYAAYRKSIGLASGDVYAMSDSERDAIYFGDYWIPCGGDELPSGLDLAVFDAAVNSGVGMSTRWLQSALNIPSDGGMGPVTKTAISNLAAEHDEPSIIRHFCSLRLGSLERLSDWKTFGKGWAARVADVQATALEWDAAPPRPLTPANPRPTPAAAKPAPLSEHSSAVIAPNPKPMAQSTAVDVRLKKGNMKAPISPERLVQPAVHPVAAQSAAFTGALMTVAAQAIQSFGPAVGAMPGIKYCLLAATAGSTILALWLSNAHRASSDAALGKREASSPP